MDKFIALMDSDGELNLFKINTIARIYVGALSGELSIQFIPGSITSHFKTTKESLEGIMKKLEIV